VQWP